MTDETVNIGHNNPPDPDRVRVDSFVTAAEVWSDLRELKDADQAARCRSFLGQIQAEIKGVEEKRKGEKQPHVDAGKAIDQRFNSLKGILNAAKAPVTDLLTRWTKREQERVEEEKRAALEVARKAREESEAAARAAEEANSVLAAIDAAAAKDAADEAERAATKASSAKAGVAGQYGERKMSIRTTWRVELVDPTKAFRRYKKDAGVHEALTKAARSEVIHDKLREIPGFVITAEEKAV